MIKLKVNNKPIEFPQGWGEITLAQWKRIEVCATDNEVAAVLLGVEVNNITLQKIYPFMLWMQVPFDYTIWSFPKSIILNGVELATNIDIKTHTFGQKILLQKLKPHEFEKSLAIYFQPILNRCEFNYEQSLYLLCEIEKLKLSEVIPINNFLLNQLKKIMEKENAELSVPATAEQTRAGIKMFDEFGVNNTIDALAGGDILKYNKVLMMDYNTIFLKLKRNKLENKFKRNYQKIMEDKK